MVKAAQYKKDIVKRIIDLASKYPIIGAVDIEGLPAPQFQAMRETLRGKVEVFVAKRRLIKIAFEEIEKSKKGSSELTNYLNGMPALLFTADNPFSLFKTLKKSKSSAPAKAGQIAPKDIVVPAGPTSFTPGPIIGELGAFGIKTSVQDGKVAVNEDTVVCKEGEEISAKLASVLTRLNIQPMEIGLNLKAVYENGTVFKSSILDIDEDKFMSDLNSASQYAFNLAVEIGYATKDTIELMITKAAGESRSLAIEAGIPADEVVPDLLAKAESQMASLKNEAKL